MALKQEWPEGWRLRDFATKIAAEVCKGTKTEIALGALAETTSSFVGRNNIHPYWDPLYLFETAQRQSLASCCCCCCFWRPSCTRGSGSCQCTKDGVTASDTWVLKQLGESCFWSSSLSSICRHEFLSSPSVCFVLHIPSRRKLSFLCQSVEQSARRQQRLSLPLVTYNFIHSLD